MKLFHATSLAYTAPEYDKTLIQTSIKTKYNNGAIGLWSSSLPDWIEIFGDKIYSFDYEGSGIVIPIKALEFIDYSKNDFKTLRGGLIAKGYDYIEVEYNDMENCTYVILDYSKIQNWKLK